MKWKKNTQTTSMGILNSRMSAAKDRISDLENELQKLPRQQQNTKDTKIAQGWASVVPGEFKRSIIKNHQNPRGTGSQLQ